MPSGSFDLQGRPIWGRSGGMVYQYGRDSTGRDTFGPGTDEAGNPLGNQDGSMIGSHDPRYEAAQQALSNHPGYVQVRVNQQGAPGGYSDLSKVTYDPTVGLITPESNIVKGPDDTLARMLLVGVGGPLLGMAGNAAFGAGEVAGPVAGASGGSGEVGGSIVGNANMPGYAGAGDEGGFGGSIVNPEPPPAGEAFTPPSEDPAYPGTGNPNYAGPEPGMGPAPVTDLSTQQAWYQPYLDKITGPGALGRFLGALPAVGAALKPLGSGPPGGGATLSQANSLMGNKVQGLTPTAHPFQSAQNDALQFKPSTPVRSLGDYLKGT